MAKIFTVSFSGAQAGAKVESFELSNGAVIRAILVGETGRGRSLGVLPVLGLDDQEVVYEAALGTSRTGRPVLRAGQQDDSNGDYVIVVAKPVHGFRGQGWIEAGKETGYRVLVSGQIADGAAGRMASSEQCVFVAEAGFEFALRRSGRLYGEADCIRFAVKKSNVVVVTEYDDVLEEIN
jgi:hypothetical protein